MTLTYPLVLSPATSSTVDPRLNGPTNIIFTFNENIVAADGDLDSSEFTITNAVYSNATLMGKELTLHLERCYRSIDCQR